MLVKQPTKSNYIDQSKLSKYKEENQYDIRYKSTVSSLWFLTKKHSAGLKTLAILGLASYLAYDKVVKHFI